MALFDKIQRAKQAAMLEPGENLTTSSTALNETSGPYDDFDQRVRTYILQTLEPFVPSGDKTGAMLLAMLRRMLKSADHDDLQAVIHHTSQFIKGLEDAGLVVDPEELISESARYLASVPGPGATDWADEAGEIDPGQTPDNPVPQDDDGAGDNESESQSGVDEQSSLVSPPDSDSGYEAEMEGNTEPDGEERSESLPADGAGG